MAVDEPTRTGNELRVERTRLRVAQKMQNVAVDPEHWRGIEKDAAERIRLLTVRCRGFRHDERKRAHLLAGVA